MVIGLNDGGGSKEFRLDWTPNLPRIVLIVIVGDMCGLIRVVTRRREGKKGKIACYLLYMRRNHLAATRQTFVIQSDDTKHFLSQIRQGPTFSETVGTFRGCEVVIC